MEQSMVTHEGQKISTQWPRINSYYPLKVDLT